MNKIFQFSTLNLIHPDNFNNRKWEGKFTIDSPLLIMVPIAADTGTAKQRKHSLNLTSN